MIRVLRQHGEQRIDVSAETQLCRMSPATIDRLLQPCRKVGGRRGLTTTRPGGLLKSSIPIRTFADWKESKPGFTEVDLVAHCGDSTQGFYLYTLCAVDVASGWSECVPVWGKGRRLTLPGLALTKRMIAAMWSRRTVMWCVVWWAMTATLQKWRINVCKGFIPAYGCI
jgi:hypothetical protein